MDFLWKWLEFCEAVAAHLLARAWAEGAPAWLAVGVVALSLLAGISFKGRNRQDRSREGRKRRVSVSFRYDSSVVAEPRNTQEDEGGFKSDLARPGLSSPKSPE